MFKRLIVALMLVCGPLAVQAGEAPPLRIESAWIRALPPSIKNTAAYLAMTNTSDSVQAVVAARADVADKVEIHTTVHRDGLVRMQQLPGLALAAGETVELSPGGTHLMLIGLAYPLTPADEVELCLVLAAGAEVCTTAQVRRDGGAGHHQHH